MTTYHLLSAAESLLVMLMAALDGVPVRPSDAVDVTKKYELVSYGDQ